MVRWSPTMAVSTASRGQMAQFKFPLGAHLTPASHCGGCREGRGFLGTRLVQRGNNEGSEGRGQRGGSS